MHLILLSGGHVLRFGFLLCIRFCLAGKSCARQHDHCHHKHKYKFSDLFSHVLPPFFLKDYLFSMTASSL